MNVEIFSKSGGPVRLVPSESVALDGPSVVRVQLQRGDVASMSRAGNDLVLTLQDGQIVRVQNFYVDNSFITPNELVLQEGSGEMWIAEADGNSTGGWAKLANWQDAFDEATAGGGGGFALPIAGLLGAGGIAAAAAGGGGGGNDSPPAPDTTPPLAPTARLLNDTGASNSDKITNDGRVQISNTEPGARLEYQIDGGAWQPVTNNQFELPEGTHQNVKVRQIDAAGNIGPAFDLGTVTVDNTPPATPTASLDNDSGVAGDGITNDGTVNVSGLEPGATVEYLNADGQWTAAPVTDGAITIPAGVYPDLQIRQVDVAGNASSPISIGAIEVDLGAAALSSAELAEDTGIPTDAITNNGQIDVTGVEPGAQVQYRNNGGDWMDVTLVDGSFILPEGSYTNLEVRQIDRAGNESPALTVQPANLVVDNSPPAAITSATMEVTGNGATTNGLVTLVGVDPTAQVEYFDSEEGDWVAVELEDGGFYLEDGSYTDLQVRQVDVAGNPSLVTDVTPTTIIVDTQAPQPITAALFDDTGIEDDGITMDGRLTITGLEAGATAQYSLDGAAWYDVPVVDGAYVLPDDIYEDLLVRQIDAAGNMSTPTAVVPDYIVVDTAAPAALIDAAIAGVSAGSATASNVITFSGYETGATLEYYDSASSSWKPAETFTTTSITLPDGVYTNLQIRQVDVAGNPGTAANVTPATITIDTDTPDSITAVLANDNGAEGDDGITNDGTLTISGLEAGTVVQFRNNGGGWTDLPLVGGNYVLEPGTYTNLEIRQIDAALNASIATQVSPANITVDISPPPPLTDPQIAVVDPSIPTNVNIVTFSGYEAGASVEYRDGPDGAWQSATLSGTTGLYVRDGTYTQLQVRQVDLAGNPSDPTPVVPGAIIIDTPEPAAIAAELLDDTGIDGDGITQNGTLEIDGVEADAVAQYSVDGIVWINLPLIAGDYILPDGVYTNLQVRQLDIAGNAGPASAVVPANITVDNSSPAALEGSLAADDGTATNDNVSSNGKIIFTNLEDGATVEYSTDGTIWQSITVDPADDSVTLPNGDYPTLQFRQTDLAGNIGTGGSFGTVRIIDADPVDALNDNISVDLGDVTAVTSAPEVLINLDVIELVDGPDGYETGQLVTIAPNSSGDIHIVVQQNSLAAVASAFAVELYNADGDLLYRATMADSGFVADVPGSGLLGLLGDDGVQASFTGLPPGDYYVIVVSDSSALNNLIQDLTLSDVGLDGTVLGAGNRAVILGALADVLDNQALEDAVLPVVGLLLDGLDGTPLPQVLELLNRTLLQFPLVVVDEVLDAVSQALISNTLTVLQQTTMETTVIQFSYDGLPEEGNVFDDNGGGGADIIAPGDVVSEVYFNDPDADPGDTPLVTPITGSGSFDIPGKYGVLTISANGEFSYKGNGAPESVGQTEVFTYKISNGLYWDTATITFVIDGDLPNAPIVTPVNDTDAIDMGDVDIVVGTTNIATNIAVLEVAGYEFTRNDGVMVTVPQGKAGSLELQISQDALVAVAPSFRVDVYDAFGNIVYTGVAADTLLVDLVGADILGVDGENNLIANIDGLAAGNYYVVVTNSGSALDTLIQDLTLADIGREDVLLGEVNQNIITGAVDTVVGDVPLVGPLVSGVVGTLLATLGATTPVTSLLSSIRNQLLLVDVALETVDAVLDEISEALISDLLSVLQFTTITTTVTEYNFADETAAGNVLDGVAGVGTDDVPANAIVGRIANSDGKAMSVNASGATTIAGKYGVLTIEQDGTYSYVAFEDPASIGMTDVFTYSVRVPGVTGFKEATLSIAITGDSLLLTDNSNSADIPWEHPVTEFDDINPMLGVLLPFSVTGETFTLDAGDVVSGTINVTVLVAAVAGGSVVLERQGQNGWDDVPNTQDDFTITVGLVGSVATIDVGALNLLPGTYRVRTTLGGVAAQINTVTDLTIVHTAQHQFDPADLPAITGELLDDDSIGTLNPILAIRAGTSGAFTDITASQDIDGQWGKLTIAADGSYSYAVKSDFPFSATPVNDIFEYQVTSPSGEVDTATLTINIDPGGVAAIPDMSGMRIMALINDFLPEEPNNGPDLNGDGPSFVPDDANDLNFVPASNPWEDQPQPMMV